MKFPIELNMADFIGCAFAAVITCAVKQTSINIVAKKAIIKFIIF